MMIARRRGGIAILDFAPRTRSRPDHCRRVKCPDHSSFRTIQGFSSRIRCPMHAFAPVLVDLRIPAVGLSGADRRTSSETRLRNCG
jgi:hypothetical protein